MKIKVSEIIRCTVLYGIHFTLYVMKYAVLYDMQFCDCTLLRGRLFHLISKTISHLLYYAAVYVSHDCYVLCCSVRISWLLLKEIEQIKYIPDAKMQCKYDGYAYVWHEKWHLINLCFINSIKIHTEHAYVLKYENWSILRITIVWKEKEKFE